MGKVKDLTGYRFGKLTVIKDTGIRKNGVIWMCLCDCGNYKKVRSCHLVNKATISCGCSSLVVDIVGNSYYRLTVYAASKKRSSKGVAYWKCICSCGNKTLVRGNSLRSGEIRSCGCLQVDSVSGENNSSWKGGITSLNEKVRKSLDYKKWALSVKEQSGNTCTMCGSPDKLVAHHIESFSKIIELRFDIDNGICLCRECHMEFHNKYGYNDFTKENFFNWITGGTW